ncbi:SDR family NAD(P)-dependent oxidoreductase [Enterococcus sp. CSURQ0835]|uniref:SDR family NAD(P)-dependent oxidoreductase n=1 Tax=Enterococcus sp. CSURQ0835 TaxID=2681394 RepID=UPI00135A6C8C|nr:SDR family NAD(P)-dependent oxidoreductase [Enterococcus sp. CSURQ0835]
MERYLLKDQVAIVTGASYGMGETIAELFAEEGAKVVLVARGAEKLNLTVERLQTKKLAVTGIVADVTSLADTKKVIKKTLAQFGTIDILVNNAGLGEQTMIDETTDEWLEQVLAVNVAGPTRYIREVLPHFLAKNEGVIINISSVNGKRPICGAAYTASKGAIDTLTKNIAIRLSETNIRCNAVAPGATLTPAHYANLAGEQPGGNKMLHYGEKYCNWELPETEPIDQAYACLYLASKMGRRVKGQVLQVCNGAFL